MGRIYNFVKRLVKKAEPLDAVLRVPETFEDRQERLWREVLRLRAAHGMAFYPAWAHARQDYKDAREVLIDEAVKSPFDTSVQARIRVRMRLGERTPLEAECYRLYTALRARNLKEQVRVRIAIEHARIATDVALRAPYGR